MQDIILQRAAELLESCFLSATTRGQTASFPQGPFVYPPSPALIGSNGVFLFTPQPITPRPPGGAINGGMLPEGLGGVGFGYGGGMTGNNGEYHRHGYMPQTAFPFPDITPHTSEGGGEIKTESQLSPPGSVPIHKHSILTNGSMIMPFNLPSYEGYATSSGGSSLPLTHGGGGIHINSNNNNNSVTEGATSINSGHLSYMSRLFPGGVPASPTFLMATHTC